MMSKPFDCRDGKVSRNAQTNTNSGQNNNGTGRRVIFPSLHRALTSLDAVKYYGSQAQQQQQELRERELEAAKKQQQQQSPPRLLERASSFPKNGLKVKESGGDKNEVFKLLPLPELPELSSLKPRKARQKRDRELRDSVCLRKAVLPNDNVLHSTPLSGKKWVVQSPQVDSLSLEKWPEQSHTSLSSHKTYYPAASVPYYHEPPVKTSVSNKPLPPILRNSSSELPSISSIRRSSMLFRQSSTLPMPTGDDDCLAQTTSRLTLASPTSIRSLNSECGCSENEVGQREGIGETESDLNKITVPAKVIHRQEKQLRRNASDTVVAKSEDGVQQRRRKSIHAENNKAPLEDSVTRHESLECLPNHKKISFDPHIWVYEYNDDRHEFDLHGDGKWFTEEELDAFKEEAVQRIRQRNAKMMSAGQGRIAMIPSPQDRNQTTPSPLPKNTSFTHPALALDDEFDPDASMRSCTRKSKESLISDALSREMRNVLVVDPHDIFLTLFTKCFKYIIPHVSVATARSGEEALSRIQAAQKAFPVTDGGAVHGFDIIVIEERLLPGNTSLSEKANSQSAGDDSIQRQRKITSGSTLIQSIVQEEKAIRDRVECIGVPHQSSIRFSLLIGVSAYLTQDEAKLKLSGADFVFGKPPPEMNSQFRNDMLKVLMKKRNNDCSLFD